MKRIVNYLASVLLLVLLAAPAQATTFGSDQTDFWYSPGEDGWAINVAHQGDTVFITWYIYGADRRPTWVSGSAPAGPPGSGGLVFSGDLYETNGPWFGGAFNPALVTIRKVGTFIFNPVTAAAGSLAYSIDGVTVSKPIERFTFKINDLTGAYSAVLSGIISGCPSGNGPAFDDFPLVITQNAGGAIQLVTGTPGDQCIIGGNYLQYGRLGAVNGTIQCDAGGSGTFQMFEVEANLSGITGRLSQIFGACRLDADLAAVRR